MKRKVAPGTPSSSLPGGGKEAVRTILEALHNCAGKLQLAEDVVSFTINRDNIQRLPDVGPAVLCSALQQHIASLQPVLDLLQGSVTEEGKRNTRLSNAEEAMEADCDNAADQAVLNIGCEPDPSVLDISCVPDPAVLDISRVPDPAVLDVSCVPERMRCVPDPAVVQIQAGKSEIDRRIWAFIERKQAEINENNIREFCNVIDCNQENSCARTDAVFTPFPGFKSHIKVSRVVNAYGPQTRSSGPSSSAKAQLDCGNQAVEERLQNMECHLQLLSGGPVPKDIYHRIKRLEDKILELEGISPEYFQSLDASNKRKKVQPARRYSLVELDQKMNALRQSLLQKSEKGIS